MSNRRDFLKMGAGVAASSVIAQATGLHAPAGKGSRPNIIMILADDMGFSDIGCFGSEVPTPNLDRLAERGMKFRQFYNTPRCCPSRASIMTGLYAHQAGFGMMTNDYQRYPWPQYAGTLSAKCITIPEALKRVGYQTAMSGKWHLTALGPGVGNENWPLQRGFDRFFGLLEGHSTYFDPPTLVEGNEHLPPVHDPSFYLTDKIADHAIQYIGEMTKQKDPFFLYCAFNAPHWPIEAPEDLIQKYATRYAEGWDKLREERHARQIDLGMVDAKWPLTPRDARVPAWNAAKDKEWEMRRMAVYAAMIDRLDQNIGRLVEKLEREGIADNTLIVFMSDNGGNSEEITQQPTGADGIEHGNIPSVMPGSGKTYQSIGIPWGNCANTPFRLYKHFCQEGGISTPFIACWPKQIDPAKQPINAVGHETDLMPTFLEAAGATYPTHVSAGPIPALAGESLIPLFEGKSRVRGPIYWEHQGNKAVRDGKWKLVSRFPQGWELYDMEADRTEMHDLSKKHPEQVARLEAMYHAWAKRIGVQQWPMPQTPADQRNGDMITPPYLGGKPLDPKIEYTN